jgi:hypothetical protein
MPNSYSHAVVLQNYQALGLLDGSARLRRPYKRKTPTSPPKQQRKSVQTTSIVTAKTTPASKANDYIRHESVKMSSLKRTPSTSTDSSTHTAIPRRYSESSNRLSATSASVNHSRHNSDTKTVVSCYSSSSASAPAPSIVTQIYAPVPSSPSQRHRRETSLASSRSLSNSSAPVHRARKPKLLDFTIQTTVNQPPVAPSPVVYTRTSLVSNPAEPSLYIDSLDFADPFIESTGTARHSLIEANRASPISPVSSTKGRLYLDLSKESNPSLRHVKREAGPSVLAVPNRSISPASLTSLEDIGADHDSEYFGSVDESSDDGLSEDEQIEPLSPNSPTSLQSLEVTIPWENPRLSVAHYRLPQGFPGAKEKVSKPQSASSSVRGFSPDDAAPPPIARVRKQDLTAFPENFPSNQRPSFSISRHLSALKPSFSSPFKRTFSMTPRKAGSSRKPYTQKMKEMELLTHSVPYDYAVPSITPIETANAASLLPPTSKALKAALRRRVSNQNFNGIKVYDDVVRGSVSTERTSPAFLPSLTADPTSPRGMNPSLRKRMSRISLKGHNKQPSDPLSMSISYDRALQATRPVLIYD